jgi:hypothetical protein
VSQFFPDKAKTNVHDNWPLVQEELKSVGLGNNNILIAYAVATILVETSTFSPTPEEPSEKSKTTDCPGYAGIHEKCIERRFGQYDSTVRFDKDGKPIINKQLGNCLYKGKDLELMRARHGDTPPPRM